MIDFSLWGFLTVIFILLPNFLFVFFTPQNIPQIKPCKNIFTIFEKTGRFWVLVFISIKIGTFEFGFNSKEIFIIWMFTTLFLVLCYWLLWVRYILKGRQFKNLFDKVIIPVPMAVLPVLVFLVTCIFTLNIMILIFAILFAIGHMVESLNTYYQI